MLKTKVIPKFHGITLSFGIAIIAMAIGSFLPIGSVALAIIVGMIVGNTIKFDEKYNSGITYSEKTLLGFAIAFMGINLDFTILTQLGFQTILLIIVALGITIGSGLLLAKFFKFDTKFALMLGIGNGVCGSAAIAATKDIIKLDKEKVGLSIAVVNFLGTIGIFTVPIIGAFIFGFNDINNGILIGNTLQAVGQVIAAGFSVSDVSGQTATIVKMGRILMLTPLIFILIYFFHKHRKVDEEKGLKKASIPTFIIGFIFFSIVATIDILPNFYVEIIKSTSYYLLLIAMAAIGLKINFKTILTHGSQALQIGSLIFLIQIIFSSLMIMVVFN
ncbi:MAG: putative sulfate exporter family transporter [Campylobacterota bacterium]|nr:putative sulfate exporter family transporter [Campylobacterota bacterium]